MLKTIQMNTAEKYLDLALNTTTISLIAIGLVTIGCQMLGII